MIEKLFEELLIRFEEEDIMKSLQVEKNEILQQQLCYQRVP